jgi:hypothetical protein
MANSKLLKEAIADAKAVRETAIANAKIALEEAFTPRLQSILSQKLQTEMEDEEEEDVELEEEYGKEDAPTGDSSTLGGEPGGTPSGKTTKAHTKLDPETGTETSAVGSELDDVTVVKEQEGDEDGDGVIDDPTGASVTEDEDVEATEEPTEDEFDLESIIKELESEIDDDDEIEGELEDEAPVEDETPVEDEAPAEDEIPVEDEAPVEDEIPAEVEDEDEDDIDLEEILREMGYGEETNEAEEADEESDGKPWDTEKEEELEEAYNVIRQLKGTINEVNLLNAKLLYSNKLFRSYDLTNEQKMKIVETLDRTINIREVKLVFATLAESLQVGGTTKKRRNKLTESFASTTTASTAPAKQIITESHDYSERFKELANIKNKK